MKWNQHNPEGRGTPRVADGWMRQFLRRGAEQQAGMLDNLLARLNGDLAKLPADALPGKEFVRIARLYQDGYRHLAQLELETAKLRLLAERAHARAPMTDEEFAAQIEALGRQAIGALSVEELEAELARKRALPAPTSDPGRSIAPKEENMNPQHQDEARER